MFENTEKNPLDRINLHQAGRQTGVVLVISLMLLVIMMILAGTTLDMSVLDERMVTNWQITNQTFQYAESAASEAENNNDLLSQAINTPDVPVDAVYTVEGSEQTTFPVGRVDYSAQGEFLGETILAGYSMGEDASSLSAFRFEVSGTANHDDGAQTTTVHGFYQIAPSLASN